MYVWESISTVVLFTQKQHRGPSLNWQHSQGKCLLFIFICLLFKLWAHPLPLLFHPQSKYKRWGRMIFYFWQGAWRNLFPWLPSSSQLTKSYRTIHLRPLQFFQKVRRIECVSLSRNLCHQYKLETKVWTYFFYWSASFEYTHPTCWQKKEMNFCFIFIVGTFANVI